MLIAYSARHRRPSLFSVCLTRLALPFSQAQFIAQSIGQAFQVAYMEFLKANGIEDQSFVREMDYQEVLNSQEIFGDELQMFAKKELQKEVRYIIMRSWNSLRTFIFLMPLLKGYRAESS